MRAWTCGRSASCSTRWSRANDHFEVRDSRVSCKPWSAPIRGGSLFRRRCNRCSARASAGSYKRLRAIGDYRFLLASTDAVPAPVRLSAPQSLLVAAGTLAAVILAFFAGTSRARDDGGAAPSPIRLSTVLPSGVSVTRGPGYTGSVAVSPDSPTVIAASDKDGQRLYRRSLDCLIRHHSPALNGDRARFSRGTACGSASSPTVVSSEFQPAAARRLTSPRRPDSRPVRVGGPTIALCSPTARTRISRCRGGGRKRRAADDRSHRAAARGAAGWAEGTLRVCGTDTRL